MEKHRLGRPEKVELDDAGWVNPCFFVNDSYVFRFNARDPHLPKYQREKLVFDLLRESDVPVPNSVALDDSKSAAPFDVLISNKVEGRNLETDWLTVPRDQQLHLASLAGDLLRRLHTREFEFFGELSSTGPLPQTKSWHDYLQAKLNFHLEEGARLKIWNHSQLEAFRSAFRHRQELLQPLTQSRLVHVDFHLGNLLYQGPNIMAVLDFEWSLAGDPLYDLCRWSSLEEDCVGSREAFLSGYGKSTFTREERASLDLYQMIRNVELCVVSQLHFESEEAEAFHTKTLGQLQNLRV